MIVQAQSLVPTIAAMRSSRSPLSSHVLRWTCFLLLSAGCTNKNVRLNAADVPLERRVRNHTRASLVLDAVAPNGQANRTGFFVGVAISGGGSRSANFSAACMLQLQRIGLLQHVDYISSVSGGSLTAAYYCLSDDQHWNPEQLQRRLSHRFASDLIRHFLLPWNMATTFFTDYDRSDLLAEIFESVLYTDHGRGLTFADLRPDRPRLLINTTDLQSGHRFVFNDETFDDINSDLSRYPIAWACAASAAVPVLLHQVTLRDYSTIFKQYRHFIDGGIADNLGIQTLVELYDAQSQAAATARRRIPMVPSLSSSTPRPASTRGCRIKAISASSNRSNSVPASPAPPCSRGPVRLQCRN
jgi:predicted acylesterase/phospholipase RssA